MSIEHYLPAADRWFDTGDSGDGSFVNKLFDLCSVADTNNKLKLFAAFPSHVGAMIARDIMGPDIMRHIDAEHEWIVRPGDPNVGNWLINRRLVSNGPFPSDDQDDIAQMVDAEVDIDDYRGPDGVLGNDAPKD